jgi:hypothetical protein
MNFYCQHFQLSLTIHPLVSMYHAICGSVDACDPIAIDSVRAIQISQVLARTLSIFDQLTGQVLIARYINTWISNKEITRFQLDLVNLDRPI